METPKKAVDFDEIIQADRKRRQHEALANEIFGRSRQTSDSNRSNSRKATQNASLASRVGVAKRSSSSTNIKSSPFNPPSRPNSAASQTARTNRIASAVNDSAQTNLIAAQSRPLPGAGLSIRGTAGPFVVAASNFAPGTTAADIESALQSVATDSSGSSGLISCRIVTASPTVIAEMVFSERHIADNVIATFNNQKADGRILHVYLARSGPSAMASSLQSHRSEPSQVLETKDLFPSTSNGTAAMEDVEMGTEAPTAKYDNARELGNQDERDRKPRRKEPENAETVENIQVDSQPSQQRDERMGGGNRRDDDREVDRDRERDRDRDRRYEDRYDRRDERSYHRSDRPDSYDSRGARLSSRYGNGRGHPGGGRMYSDSMLRGGGHGGGFRGAYRGYR